MTPCPHCPGYDLGFVTPSRLHCVKCKRLFRQYEKASSLHFVSLLVEEREPAAALDPSVGGRFRPADRDYEFVSKAHKASLPVNGAPPFELIDYELDEIIKCSEVVFEPMRGGYIAVAIVPEDWAPDGSCGHAFARAGSAERAVEILRVMIRNSWRAYHGRRE